MKRYTEQDFRDFVDGTKTIDDVMEHFGVSQYYAYFRCSTLGLKMKNKRTKDCPGLEEYRKTHTVRECLEKYKISEATFYRKTGLNSKPTLRDKMIQTLSETYSPSDISRAFNISVAEVRRSINVYNR